MWSHDDDLIIIIIIIMIMTAMTNFGYFNLSSFQSLYRKQQRTFISSCIIQHFVIGIGIIYTLHYYAYM